MLVNILHTVENQLRIALAEIEDSNQGSAPTLVIEYDHPRVYVCGPANLTLHLRSDGPKISHNEHPTPYLDVVEDLKVIQGIMCKLAEKVPDYPWPEEFRA